MRELVKWWWCKRLLIICSSIHHSNNINITCPCPNPNIITNRLIPWMLLCQEVTILLDLLTTQTGWEWIWSCARQWRATIVITLGVTHRITINTHRVSTEDQAWRRTTISNTYWTAQRHSIAIITKTLTLRLQPTISHQILTTTQWLRKHLFNTVGKSARPWEGPVFRVKRKNDKREWFE